MKTGFFISGMEEALNMISKFGTEISECPDCVSFWIIAKNDDGEIRNLSSFEFKCGNSFVSEDCVKEVRRYIVDRKRERGIPMEYSIYSLKSVTLIFRTARNYGIPEYEYCLKWNAESRRFEDIMRSTHRELIVRDLRAEESAKIHSFMDIRSLIV